MNITLKNIDPVNAIITISIVKDDYASNVDNSLKKFRQRAEIPGFRKGMVPLGMIKKLYGESILAEEINKLVSDNLFSYIKDNQLNILGEPLPNETEQKEIDFKTQEDFDFAFDIAIAPEIKVELNKKDKLPFYTVEIDEEMLNKQIDSYKANYGTYKEADVFSEKDMLKGTLTEMENGEEKENGLKVEDAVMMPAYIKEEAEKAKFNAPKKGDAILFNPSVAYENNTAEIASLLKIDKADVAKHTGEFKYEVQEITHYEEAELNQELFDKVFAPGEVTSEEEFKEKVRATLAAQFESNSDYKFMLDARKLLDKKAGEVAFPDAFLKRWLLASDEKKTAESIEEEYPKIVEDLKYHLIKEQLVKDNEIKLEESDFMDFARKATKAQFAQYGMMTVPEDLLDNYAKEMLKDKNSVRNIADRAIEEKLIVCIKDKVKIDEKSLSMEKFSKLFEE